MVCGQGGEADQSFDGSMAGARCRSGGDCAADRGVLWVHPIMPKRPVNDRATLARRDVAIAAIAAVVVFAVQGGEWSTLDLVLQKRRVARLEIAVDSLQHVVDSLKRYRRRIDTDPALQERIAREEFGMVRGSKELLYRYTEPSDSARSRR